VLSQDGSGMTVGGVPQSVLPAQCQALVGQGGRGGLSCLKTAGYHQYVTFQPGSRYWAFQGIETGIFVVLAAALIVVAFAVVTRRDA
jgi:hypothetical protein